MSRLSKQDRNHMETAFHGPVSRRVLAALDAAEANEADLKARLKAAHMTYFGTRGERIDAGADFDEDNGEDFDDALRRVTDLRNKSWRKARGEGR